MIYMIYNKHDAFNSLFNKYYVRLCIYVESIIGDKPTAEDLVQDVFVQLWMKRTELNFDETVIRPYLYRAAHNAGIHFLRCQKVRDRYNTRINTKLTETELIPFEWVTIDTDPSEANEIQSLYEQALKQLSAQTREIFLCSREKGMRYAEIAETAGLSIKSVEYHISKALDVFRDVLKDFIS